MDAQGGMSDLMTEDDATDCARDWNRLGHGPCEIALDQCAVNDVRRDGRDDEGLI